MSSQVACLYFYPLYTSFLYLIFAKNILFIHAGVLAFLPGLLLVQIDHSWAWKGWSFNISVCLDLSSLQGLTWRGQRLLFCWRTTWSLRHSICKWVSGLSLILVLPGWSSLAWSQNKKTSTFLPWKDGPDTPWGCQPCCLFWCCSGHTRTWGHTRTLVWIDPCLHELTSCVGWPVYAGWRKGEERGKRKWAVEWWYK